MIVFVWIANLLVLPILLILFVLYVIMGGIAILLKLEKTRRLALNGAIGIDQAANALLGGNRDHTMSGRMGYRIKTGKATKFELWLCKLLSAIDTNSDDHCVDSIEYDEVEK